MRKSALFLAALLAVTAPSLAYAAKKGKKMKPAPAAQPAKAVDNSKFFGEAIRQIVVPLESLAGKPAKAAKKGKKKKGKK